MLQGEEPLGSPHAVPSGSCWWQLMAEVRTQGSCWLVLLQCVPPCPQLQSWEATLVARHLFVPLEPHTLWCWPEMRTGETTPSSLSLQGPGLLGDGDRPWCCSPGS